MNKLTKITEEVIADIVPISEDKEAISQAIQLQKKFGSGKSVNLLDKYEKIIEDLIK